MFDITTIYSIFIFLTEKIHKEINALLFMEVQWFVVLMKSTILHCDRFSAAVPSMVQCETRTPLNNMFSYKAVSTSSKNDA